MENISILNLQYVVLYIEEHFIIQLVFVSEKERYRQILLWQTLNKAVNISPECFIRLFLLSQDQSEFLSPSGTPDLFMLPHDSSSSESIFILVPVRLWDRLRDSLRTSNIQKEVCARTLFSPGYGHAVTSCLSTGPESAFQIPSTVLSFNLSSHVRGYFIGIRLLCVWEKRIVVNNYN